MPWENRAAPDGVRVPLRAYRKIPIPFFRKFIASLIAARRKVFVHLFFYFVLDFLCVVGRSNGFSRKNRNDSCVASISPGQYVNLILGQPHRVFTCFTHHVFKFEGNCPKFFPFFIFIVSYLPFDYCCGLYTFKVFDFWPERSMDVLVHQNYYARG